MGNIVAIVGRPNVGKSTLFNRLTESREAIVDETSGVTRDRHYGVAEWNGQKFSVIDTGGYIVGSADVFEKEIRSQVQAAIKEADFLIFVTDVTTGISDYDQQVAAIIRKSGKKAFLVVNKVDNFERLNETSEFYALGFDEFFPVASINGSGTGELLDAVAGSFNKSEIEDFADIPKIAIVGQPNVGKSSLLNTLIGEDRTIVTPIPGTTRDSIHSRYKAFGFDLLLVDTAGLRKKAKVREDIEFYSVMRTIRSIEEADVCLLLLDATMGIESQDMSIFQVIQKNKKGLVIVVNKWDLVEKDTKSTKSYEEAIRKKMAPFKDVPIVFTSVTEKQRIFKALEMGVAVYKNRKQKIPTSQLNKFFLPLMENYPPRVLKGKTVKVKYVTQLPTNSPTFAFFCNLPQYVREDYVRFLENKFREQFNFTGVPISFVFRKKGE